MVVADTVYGTGEVEMTLRRAGKGYVLGTNATQPFNAWIGKPEVAGTAEQIAQGLDASAWQHLSAGEGTKGARLYDWAYLELADLEADEFNEALSGTWTRGLLVRRSLADGKCAYFSTWCHRAAIPRRDVSEADRGGHQHRNLGRRRGAALGNRGRVRDRQERARPRPQRDPVLARLAPSRLAGHARVCHAGHHPPPLPQAIRLRCRRPHSRRRGEPAGPFANPAARDSCSARALVRWSVQEIRRIATRLAQRRIRPAHVIAGSLWRRAHQAAARRSHLKRKAQL
jgi:hypothetical protein